MATKVAEAMALLEQADVMLASAHVLLADELANPGQEPEASPARDRWQAAVMELEPDNPRGAWGMSDKTAKAMVGMSGGRAASKRIVEINRNRELPADYFERVTQAAEERDIPPVLLIAIFCRESNHGAALDRNGYGDRGNGFGVGQVDSRYHNQQGTANPYSLQHMRQAAEIFDDYRDRIAKKKKSWADKYILKGTCVAYNSGPGNVATIEHMDRGTTGHDYGSDTMTRAQFYAGMDS